MAEPAQHRRRRPALPRGIPGDPGRDRPEPAGLLGLRPADRRPDLLAQGRGLLPRRPAGAGPVADARAQAPLPLPGQGALRSARAPGGHRRPRGRGQHALRSGLRPGRASDRPGARPDGALAAQRAAPHRELRLPQRVDDDGVLDRRHPPPPHAQRRQRACCATISASRAAGASPARSSGARQPCRRRRGAAAGSSGCAAPSGRSPFAWSVRARPRGTPTRRSARHDRTVLRRRGPAGLDGGGRARASPPPPTFRPIAGSMLGTARWVRTGGSRP